MNTLKVKKYRNKNGKRLFLSLHERINIFAQRDDTLKDILISIKWIGNYGSHQDEIVSPDDILDGYFLIEYALNKIYVNTEKEIKKIVNEINRSRKPRSKKK
jgi:hypothetical protein